MHTALWKLYRLQVRGSIRSMGVKLKSVRGALLAVFTLLVFGMMIGPSLLMALKVDRAEVTGHSANSLCEVIPVAMLLFVVMSIVTSLGERAIYFSPSDVDFLFPAPFSRRQILLHKILSSVTGAVAVALFFSISLLIHLRSWPAAAVGLFLAVLMSNSLTMCAQLVAQSVTERAFSRGRKLLLGGVIAAFAGVLGQAASQGLNGPWQETLLRARHAPAAEIVLAPFTVFAQIITAERLIPDALGWVALGATLVVGVYAIAIWLDANYLETAVRVSQQMQERKRRIVSGGVFAAHAKRPVRSSRLCQPPWLGGVGPVAWRQVVQSLRGSRGAIVLAAIVVAAIGAPLAFAAPRNNALPTILPHAIIGIAAYATFIYSAQAPLGFRGDYGRMDLLRSLPIRPLAMACGQILVVSMILTLLDWLVFAAAAIFAPAAVVELLTAGLLALFFNWIVFGTESLLFLLYPSPLVATGSDGFLKMGRVMLFMLAKLLVLGVCGVVAAIPASIVYFVTESLLASCLAAWFVLLIPALGILLSVAWAFQRFDVSDSVAE
jgi:ABC-type transport system involved in multi-copper enzyme maturation permease subunit